jgi:hypothetical protein
LSLLQQTALALVIAASTLGGWGSTADAQGANPKGSGLSASVVGVEQPDFYISKVSPDRSFCNEITFTVTLSPRPVATWMAVSSPQEVVIGVFSGLGPPVYRTAGLPPRGAPKR